MTRAEADAVAHQLNRVPAGYFVGMDADGVGSQLFTAGSRPEFPPGTVAVPGRWDNASPYTAHDVEALLAGDIWDWR